MQPMSIAVHMELLEVSELVEWVMLEIVRLDLLVLGGFWLILES